MLNINDFWKIFEVVRGNEDQDISEIIKNLAKSEKANSQFLFETRLDQNVFATNDYKRIRNFLIDWYASHKTLTTIQKKYSDPYSMDDALLDELFRSFGFNFSPGIVTKGSTINHNKINLLLDLVRLYRIKGTPESIVSALKYFGFTDLDLVEYFLRKDSLGNLVFESTIIAGSGNTGTSLLKRYTEFDAMIENDPHWFTSKQDIENYLSNPSNRIALPSKSPYFSLRVTYDSGETAAIISYLKRVALEQYVEWDLNGTRPPIDALISITGTQCSFLELYTSTIYILFAYFLETNGYDPQDLFLIYDGTSNITADIITDYQYYSNYYLSNQNFFTAESGNLIGNTSYIVKEDISDNTPLEGYIDIKLSSLVPSYKSNKYKYSSWSGRTFILDQPLYSDIPEDTSTSVICNPRKTRRDRLNEFNDKFTRPKPEDFLQQKIDSQTILEEINPALKAELDTILDITPAIKLISPFLKDIDNWVRVNVPEAFPKIAYHMYGSDIILEDVGEVINFFKPFRSRLRSVEVINAFTNRLTESCPIEDSVNKTLKEHIKLQVPLYDVMITNFEDIFADNLTCVKTSSGYAGLNTTQTAVTTTDNATIIGDTTGVDYTRWESLDGKAQFYITITDEFGNKLSGYIGECPNSYTMNIYNTGTLWNGTRNWIGNVGSFVGPLVSFSITVLMSNSYAYYGDLNSLTGDLILFSTGGFQDFDAEGAKYDCTFANDIVQIQVNELGDEILSDTFSG